MRRAFLQSIGVAGAASAVFAGAAWASGPAAPGKELIDLNCEGLGVVTVSVQRGENSNGAGQIVGARGHGIPVAFTFTLVDVTTSAVLDSESSAVGNGNAHPNQATTTCSGVVFEGAASEVFDADLPPGVAPTDVIQAVIEAQVILKP